MFCHKNSKKVSFRGLLIALMALISFLGKTPLVYSADAPKTEEINQANAQKTAENLNNRGSDDSLEAATTSGMTALMNLAALNIGGAVHYGYKAYGQYNNSEELEDLKEKTNSLKNSMASNGAKPLGDGSSISGTRKTFARLKSDFLYNGEASVVAAEWEKRTGMRRDDFFNQLVSASEAGLSFDDPNLMQKLEQRYLAFKSKVTNKDFLAGMNKLEEMYPANERLKLLAKAAEKYRESKTSVAQAATETKTVVAAAASPILGNTTDKVKHAPVEKIQKSSAEDYARLPASASGIPARDKLGSFIGVEAGKDDAFEELIKGATAAPDLEDETIFQRVSKKYKLIFAGVANSATSETANSAK